MALISLKLEVVEVEGVEVVEVEVEEVVEVEVVEVVGLEVVEEVSSRPSQNDIPGREDMFHIKRTAPPWRKTCLVM
ncbi:unnamed protein product [Merluccius merluccius]